MKFQPRCTECLLSRVVYEAGLVLDDQNRIEAIRRTAEVVLNEGKDSGIAAPVIASAVHRCAYEMIGSDDPYSELKRQNNTDALAAAKVVEPRLSTFRDYVCAAVLANTFDYGVQSHHVTDDFLAFFDEEFSKGLTIDETDAIFPLCDRVVYLTDNCGEVVFDRLLIQYLKKAGAEVTVVVRGAPILNDATLKDAHALELDTLADRLLTTTAGERELGVNLDVATPELLEALDQCTLVIAKGMANYESLTEYDDFPPVAHMMAVKCETIAEMVKVPKGSRVALLRE